MSWTWLETMASEFSLLSKEELSNYLESEDLDEAVIETIERNRITGATFMDLNKELLKELFPVVGDRLVVSKLVDKLKATEASPAVPSQSNAGPSQSQSHASGGWLDDFTVPSEFSHYTKEAIRTGVLTKSATIEIIGALSTRVLQYTRSPSPNEYQTVCKKLIQMYPTLEDPIGNGYGTWKCQLRNKFKNIRRGEKPKESDHATPLESNHHTETPPASKRRKTAITDEKYEECEYEHRMDLIYQEWDKPRPKISTLKQLMDSTYSSRRKWIEESCPLATDVLKKYPCFASGKILRHEFTKIVDLNSKSTDDLTRDWSLWVKRVFMYSSLESKSRVALRDLLVQYEETKEGRNEDNHAGVFFLLLLGVLLSGKRGSALKLIYQFSDSVNIEEEIVKIDKGSPYIVMLLSEEGQQFYVVVEKTLIAESGHITTAIVDLISSYFVFDIVYPKPLYPALICVQHYVLGVPDSQKVPHSVNVLYSSVVKINV